MSVDLARVVPSLVPKRQQDCGIACEEAIGYCLDWKEVVLFPALQEIVVSTNASVFVGRDLGRSKAWTSTVQRLPLAVAIPTFLIGYAPAFLKSLFKPIIFAPAIWIRFRMSRMLRPVLQKDVDMYWTSKGNGVLEVSPVNDKVPLSRWLLQRYPAGVKDVYSRLMDDYISLSFESTPSSAGTLYYILVELAADPELAEVLRKEVLSITLDGKLPSTQLSELDKMDSVMRESARVNPFSYRKQPKARAPRCCSRASWPAHLLLLIDLANLSTCPVIIVVLYRRVMQPLQLSAGPLLPAGTNICVDAHHINFSPELWERPFEFDGLRHHRARQKQKERSGKKNSFRFANLAADYPGWGDGLQACPGRAFADNTLKIILARLLIQYEFRLRPGEGKPKKGSMPNGSMYPDVKARIMFRSRRWASG